MIEYIGCSSAKDYFMTFNNGCDFATMTENQAYKIMHSGEFIFDE